MAHTMKMISLTDKQKVQRDNGIFLGYPLCCIKEFIEKPSYLEDRVQRVQQTSVNGFVPCPSCAMKLYHNEVSYEELINTRRRCSLPFRKRKFGSRQIRKINLEIFQNRQKIDIKEKTPFSLFTKQMLQELLENSEKGDWTEFKDQKAILSEIYHHVYKLQEAVHSEDIDKIKEYSVDVSNYCLFMFNSVIK